jgi:acyl carrier protein
MTFDDDDVRPAVLEILSDLLGLPIPELVAQPALAAHQWDSMISLEALAQLESAFGIELDLRSFHTVRTVDEVVRLTAGAVADATAKVQPE